MNTNPIYNICINREILISNEYNYKLEICIDRNLNNNTIDDSFLFTFGESNDNEEKLLHCLSIISYKLSKHIDNYSEAYNNFIINTDFSVDKDFKKNSNNFDTIQNSYYMFNEYLNHKNFIELLKI